MQPIDVLWGADPREPRVRAEVLRLQMEHRPRLVIIQFPCTYWSPIQRLNARTTKDKRRLALELVVAMAEQQMRAGDYFLIENPAKSAARKIHPITDSLTAPEVPHA